MQNNFTPVLTGNTSSDPIEKETSLTREPTTDSSLTVQVNDHIVVWNRFLDLLKDSITESEITTWFSVVKPKSVNENTLTVIVPSEVYFGLIQTKFNKFISNIIISLLGENGRLLYEVKNETSDHINGFNKYENKIPEKGSEQKIFDISGTNISYKETNYSIHEDNFVTNLNAKHTFSNFIKGESNELATAAAYAISNNPGKTYNPFFIYGGVGLGKTHLIQALGNEIIKKDPRKKVYYTTAPDFTTQFTTNIANDKIDFSSGKGGTKKLDAFYKSLDVLILDDIQNLSGKEKTQDFMYQIFNTLFNEKKHIIFSSDKPINQIKGIEERLISRFQWGMTVDIQPPNWEMRVAIIQRKLDENAIEVPMEVIHFIATGVCDSIRTLEGCIIGLIAESVLINNKKLTIDVAEKVINRVVGNVKRTSNITISNIITTVAAYYNISEGAMVTKKRTKEIAFTRQVAMFLSKELTNFTLQHIGLNFGGRDHATVLYANNVINEEIKNNPKFAGELKEIRELLKNQ
ncbi:chromosomal replication initiator protein DnaA [soil metagenome]